MGYWKWLKEQIKGSIFAEWTFWRPFFIMISSFFGIVFLSVKFLPIQYRALSAIPIVIIFVLTLLYEIYKEEKKSNKVN